MNKKELNFLLRLHETQQGEIPTRGEIDEISKYLKNNFNTIYLEVDETYTREKDIENNNQEKNNDNSKKHGKGFKKKHRKHVKKKRYKSKKWNRY